MVKVCTTTFTLKESLKSESERINLESLLSVYQLNLTEEDMNINGCQRLSFGKESERQNRTILLFGAIGSGKSSLINGMINYIAGVEWKDPFRFQLVDVDESQTSEVTVYKINHQDGFKIDHSLTIVDTPAFVCKIGLDEDEANIDSLRDLFSNEHSLSEIDAVCFVASAALEQLIPLDVDVLNSVLSIFGKDVAENILILVTFADSQQPPVLEAINASGVPCPKTRGGLPVHFKFNNSALFADNKSPAASMTDEDKNEDEDGGFDRMCWNLGTEGMKRFFLALNMMETKSLTMTKEVLRERRNLENPFDFYTSLAKLEEIKSLTETLTLFLIDYDAGVEVDENDEFEITVEKPVEKTKEISVAGFHHYKLDFEKFYETTTVSELMEKYNEEPGQALLDKLWVEHDLVQDEVKTLIWRYSESVNRLKEIALSPGPLCCREFIDRCVEEEQNKEELGWTQRIFYLVGIRSNLK